MYPNRPADVYCLALVAVVFAAVSIYPAFLNSFPLVFSDSGAYIGDYRSPGLPPFYTVFVWITSFRVELWLTLAAQALIAGVTVAIFLRAAGMIGSWRLIGGAGVTVLLLNQLPWLTSWIMPDFLAGLGVVALCLLLLLPERLNWLEITFLLGIVLLAAVTATANLPIYLGLAIVCFATRVLVQRRRPPAASTLATLAALILSACSILTANKLLHGRAELNSAGPVLTFSRLADTGIAQPYVRKHCETASLAICQHLSALEAFEPGAQTFLWDGVADATDARGANRNEYAKLVSEIVQARWQAILRRGLSDALVLFLRPTQTVDGPFGELSPRGPDSAPGNWIAAKYPRAAADFAVSRQQQDTLRAIFPSRFYAVSTYASYAAILLLGLAAWRHGDKASLCLVVAIAAAVIGDLVLHGLLVGAYPRYHVKVGWLGWLFAAALVGRLLEARRFSHAREGECLGNHG